MRKFITLSLMAAGLMAFSASAAMPDAPFRGKVTQEYQSEIVVPNLSELQNNIRKSPSKAHPAVVDGMIEAGMYGIQSFATRDQQSYQRQGMYCYLSPSETVANEYDFMLVFGAQGLKTRNIVKVTYDPATKMLSIPGDKAQFVIEASGEEIEIKMLPVVIGWEKTQDKPDGTYYTDIKEDVPLRFILEGDNFVLYRDTQNDPQITGKETDFGMFYLGQIVDSENLRGFGFFENSTMSYATATGVTKVTLNSSSYSYLFFPDINFNNKYTFEFTNFLGLFNSEFPIYMDANKDTKTLSSSKYGPQVAYAYSDGTESETYYLLAPESQDPSYAPSGTYSVEPVSDESGDYYVTTFTFNESLMPYDLATNYTMGTFTETMIEWPTNANIDDYIAIEGVESDLNNADAPVQYFDLQGRKVNGENLSNGIYVRRQGTDVQKVFVK